MPKFVYAVAARDILVERDSDAMTLERTMEYAVMRRIPGTLPPVNLVTAWEVEPGGAPFEVEVRLVRPDGGKSVLGSQEVRPGRAMLHKLNFIFQNLAVQSEGRHALIVALREGGRALKAAELPLFAVAAPQGGQASGQQG